MASVTPPLPHNDASAPKAGALGAAGSGSIHPAWVRASHWINAVAVGILATSGWKIYNASPLWDFRFPSEWTLGGWLAGALQWHFAAMWLLAANGVVYLALTVGTGRLARRLLPVHPREVWSDLKAAMRGGLQHADPARYNAVQRAAYLAVILGLITLVLSGLVLWKPVQFPLLREAMAGYEGARRVHFVAMAGVMLFIALHVVMVALVPRSLVSMLRGR
jgi:thiosulfate reductase cytochrome b subunit